MNKIAWEKWVDFDEEDLIIDNSDEFEEDEEEFRSVEIEPIMIRTPLGVYSPFEPMTPSKMFDCWVMHTNFDISDEIVRINKLIEALRNAMYSAKGMKDVYQDKTEFSNSINEVKYEMYHQFQSELSEFYKLLYVSFTNKEMNNGLESISSLLEKNKTDFDERINHIYFHAGQNMLKEKDIATLFNLNRELYSSCKAIALAVKDYKDKSI